LARGVARGRHGLDAPTRVLASDAERGTYEGIGSHDWGCATLPGMGNVTDDRMALVSRINAKARGAHAAFSYLSSFMFGEREVARYRMQNGLKVLMLRDGSAPVASYHTWFGVGSRHEKPGKTGLAHLFEHLMFNETEGLKPGEFDRLLEAAGGEVNAATWVDWTFYYENVPSSELPLVIRLEALRMSKLVLREPQVKSEKDVVANERRYRVEDDVEGSVNELLYKTAFIKHPYHWPTIGWMEDIQGFTTEDCEKFYATYYAPNNATVVVVGDIDEEATLALLQEHYGNLAASTIPAHESVTEPVQTEERVLEIDKPTPTEKLLLGYRGPALGEADFATITVLNEVLFGGKSSRLYRALISEGELASDARGSLSPFREPGLYEIWVSVREGRTAREALAIVERALSLLGTQLVSAAELDKAKNRIELGFLHGMETASGKAEQIGFYETSLGDAARIFAQLEAYRAVTSEAILELAKRVLVPSRRTTLIVHPNGEVTDDEGDEEEAA
jgi:zinc protease